MAGTTVLERETAFRVEERRDSVAQAEEEHKKRISDNYQRIVRGETDLKEKPAPAQPARSVAAQRLSDNFAIASEITGRQRMSSDAPSYSSQRVVDYAPVAEPAAPEKAAAPARTPLFEGVSFHRGETATASAPAYVPAYEPTYTPTPVQEPVKPVYAPEYDPSYTPSEEDALPTRKTMSTIRREEETDKEVGFFAALSTKTKLVLAAVVAAIAVLIALVCINTAVLKSLNTDISTREAEIVRLSQESQNIQAEIAEVTDAENVSEWALEQGMIRVAG